MSMKLSTYLTNLTGVELTEEQQQSTFVFQLERILFKQQNEIAFLEAVQPDIQKSFTVTEDELVITANIPSSYRRFNDILKEDEKSKWLFAHQLVQQVMTHSYDRLHLVVCPENIVYNRGLRPSFLFYGVLDSLPPFEQDDERVWRETKAAVAAVVDRTYGFEDYYKYYETLNLQEIGANVMAMPDEVALLAFLEEQLNHIEKKQQEAITMPLKKWKSVKWFAIGLILLCIPALISTLIFFIYEKPKNVAYTDSHEYFLASQYSDVVTTLSPYKVKRMPYVVLYELAYSYVTNERLDEEQKDNVRANITLQTDADYLKYWIYIGRGEAAKALELARAMEDGELIIFGLLKRREEIQVDSKLTSDEKQQYLKEIDTEVDEYERLMKLEEEES